MTAQSDPASAEMIDAYAAGLWRGAAPLLAGPLADAARRRLGGRLFEHDFLLVRAVAAGMQDAPALFPDLALTGPELAAQQDRADAFRQARDQLLYLARCAHDGYLREQAAGVDEAMSVIHQVRASAALPSDVGLPPDRERRRALHQALALLSDRQRRNIRTRAARVSATRKKLKKRL